MATAIILRRRIACLAASVVGVGVLVAVPSFAAGGSVANSNAIINLSTGTAATSDARIIHHKEISRLPGSQVATVVVTVKDEAGTPLTSETLSVTNSGPGALGTGTGSPADFVPAGQAVSVTASASVPGKYVFALFADGRGGFSTVSIFDGPTLLATKFAAFYGPVAFLTAFQNLALPNVNGAPLGSNSAHNPGDGTYVNAPAVILTAKDGNGVPVPNEPAAEFSASSSDLTILSPAISVIPDDGLGTGSLGAGTYNVQIHSASGGVSGRSAKLTFRYSADNGPFISSAPLTFTTSSSMISKVLMSLDKASYGPGENATLSISALDGAGNPVSDQDAGNFFASSAGLSTSLPVNKLLFPFTTVTFIRGKATTTLDLPIASGILTLSGRLGNGSNLATTLQGLPVSASLTVLTTQDVDSAQTRVLAAASERSATAALDAVLALTAIVKSLVAIIVKIQKKLGVK